MSPLTLHIKKRPDAMMWQWSSAADYAWAVETTLRTAQPDYVVPEISEQAFEGTRVELLTLRQRWNELPSGQTLELAFPGEHVAR